MDPMKKVAVTGGAGFIGSHLASELVRQGCHVTILDDLSTGKLENIEEILKNQNVEFIKGSITDLALLHQVFKDVHYVYHQAAISSVPRSIESPLAPHEVNITGTLNVLLASRDNAVKKVIFDNAGVPEAEYPPEIATPSKKLCVVNGKVKPCERAEDIMLVITGAPNPSHLVTIPTFGPTRAVTRLIHVKD